MLSSPTPTDLSTFLSFPSPEKLLRLGPKVSVLIVQQVRAPSLPPLFTKLGWSVSCNVKRVPATS